jgi:hypothetical protein
MTLMKSMASLHQGPKVSNAKPLLKLCSIQFFLWFMISHDKSMNHFHLGYPSVVQN